MPKIRREKGKLHLNIPAGHVAFRLITSESSAKSVIGRGGTTQKRILRETGVWIIRVDDPCSASGGGGERVVNVIGPKTISRTLLLNDGGGGRVTLEVSSAQEALIRVYETIEAAFTASTRTCRLLVLFDSEVLKREDELMRIEIYSGASVRVLNPEMLPLCADLSDELIEITGPSLAVKKALVAVTYCLQGDWNRLSHSRASTSSEPSHDPCVQKERCNVMDSGKFNQTLISDVGTSEVAFKLICPTNASGGWEDTIIKDLEKESGASILVSPPVLGCDELVITVSAMESKDWQYSPAQNAAASVFSISTVDGNISGHSSRGTSGTTATAKLLISLNQANGVDLTSNVDDTELQILDDHHCQLVSADQIIIQIAGEPSDVHVRLFQVTWKLREKMFSEKLVKKNRPLLPHEILGRPPCSHQTVSITEAVEHLALSDRVNEQPKVLPSKVSPKDHLTITAFNQADCDVASLATSPSSENGSEDGYAFIENTEVEIVIPAHAYGHFYGEGGCNMARVRQMTGASVIIHDTSPGTNGRATISGTVDQTEAAMSMLFAFVNQK